MQKKSEWLKRLTAAVLSVGMVLAPAVAESGLTYADVKAPERSRGLMAASESNPTPDDATPSDATLEFAQDALTEVTFGDIFTLKVVTSPSNAEVLWNVDSGNFISFTDNAANHISTDGSMEFKATGVGTAKIQATIAEDGYTEVSKTHDVTVNALQLELNKTAETLEVGGTLQAEVTNAPEGTMISWASSNENVVTVDETTGIVTAVAVGNAEIKAGADNCEPAYLKVTVEEKAEPEQPEEKASISLNKTELELEAGKTEQLTATVTPSNAQISWKSDKADVADVDATGKVTAKAEGTAIITASIEGAEATCEVTVTKSAEPENPEQTELKLDVSEFLLTKGAKRTLKVTNAPEGTVLNWTSADEKVATVDKMTGDVTAVAAGETEITVSGENCKAATAVVTVTDETGVILEGNSEVAVSVNKDDVKVPSNENLPDSVTAEELAAATAKAAEDALNSVKNNTAVLEPAEGLKEAVKVELPEGYKGVSRVDSNLKNMEMTAEMVNGELKVRPSRLVYDASVFMNIFDENGNMVDPDRAVSNKEIGGVITFRLAIPGTVTEKYAQIVHRSNDHYDSNIRNREIQNKGTDNAYIIVSVDHFSEFDITFTNQIVTGGSSSGHSGSGSGGGSSYRAPYEGTWMQDATGWWYKFPNHTWAANCWTQLTWNGVSQWYRFNEAGYMVTGWYLDTDGNWYFLHNVSDGSQGHMYTGWHQIEGKWYYFRENAGGPVGSLVVNGTTPDGYSVDANGVWIQ